MKRILLISLALVLSLVSCAPAPTPVPTLATAPASSGSGISPAVVTVDMFYTFINVAQTSDDLGNSWSMLTNEAQCNPFYKCELSNFQTKWWASKALYRLYSCDANTVLVEEMQYPRESNAPAELTDAKYWIYELMNKNGLMMISKIRSVKEPGSECNLSIDRVVNP